MTAVTSCGPFAGKNGASRCLAETVVYAMESPRVTLKGLNGFATILYIPGK